MREIKFRIYFEADEDEPAWMSEPITLLDLLHGEDIEFRNEENTVSLPLNDFRFFYKPNEKYKIMQYTGLRDKNGKEIYEGDIIYAGGNIDEKYLISQNICGWEMRNIKKPRQHKSFHFLHKYEVIGNIWEDSDLLNDSKNTETN